MPLWKRIPWSRLGTLAVVGGLAFSAAACGGGDSSDVVFVDGIEGTRSKQLGNILASHGPAVAVPAFQAFVEAAHRIGTAAAVPCSAPPPTDLTALESAWRDAMAAWMRAKVVSFGPIEDENRDLRVQFWPDANGNVPRAVEQILARDVELSAASLATQPAPTQGLSALEYVLFAPPARTRLLDASTGSRSCQLVVAIAANLESIGQTLVDAWTPAPGGEGYSDTLAGAGAGNEEFPTRREAVEEIVSALLVGTQTVQSRLGDPLPAATGGGPRPDRTESNRSRNTLDNLDHSLEGLFAMYLGGSRGTDYGFDDLLRESVQEDLHLRIRARFRATTSAVKAVGSSLEEAAVSAEGRERIRAAITEANLLHRILEDELATATGTIVGFNDLDGD